MTRSLVCLSMLLLLGAQSADAQRRNSRHHDRDRDRPRSGAVEFGVRGGYDFEEDIGLAGAQLRIPLARQLYLIPSGDVFFDDAPTQWQLNADAALRPDALGGVYGGVGAAFVNRDFDADGERDTEAGYNLFAGFEGGWIGGTSIRPFAEARWTEVDNYDPFRLVAGINVPVGGGFW